MTRPAAGPAGGPPPRPPSTARTASTAGRRGPPDTSVRPCTPPPCSRRPWPGCCAAWTRRWAGRPGSTSSTWPRAGASWPHGVLAALPAEVNARTRAYAVEVAGRPAALDHRIEWLSEPPKNITGLLFANEWLDNVPVEIAETDSSGLPRRVLVRRDGRERLGEPVSRRGGRVAGPVVAAAGRGRAAGRDRPAPGRGLGVGGGDGRPGTRGRRRLHAHRVLAPPVRDAHRLPGGARERTGTGRVVRPHGPCGAGRLRAPRRARADPARCPARPGHRGRTPPLSLASTQPAEYVRALARAGEAAELTAAGGLGDFGWLIQPVGVDGLLVDVPDHEEQ